MPRRSRRITSSCSMCDVRPPLPARGGGKSQPHDRARDHSAGRKAAAARRSFDPGAAAVCGRAVSSDRAAARLARGLRLHRQDRRVHARQFPQPGGRCGLSRSAVDHLRARHPVGGHLLRGGRADGLVGVAHRHALAPHRAPAGDRVVCHAAFHRRHRLGVAGGAEQRAAQSVVPRSDRRRRRHASA